MGAAPQIGSILSEQRACVGIRANVYFRHWDLTPAKRGSFDIVGLCMNQYCSKIQHAVSIENTSTTEQIAPSGMSGIHKGIRFQTSSSNTRSRTHDTSSPALCAKMGACQCCCSCCGYDVALDEFEGLVVSPKSDQIIEARVECHCPPDATAVNGRAEQEALDGRIGKPMQQCRLRRRRVTWAKTAQV